MLKERYRSLYKLLSKSIPQRRLLYDELNRLAYGTDASFYRLLPQLVVKVESEAEVLSLFQSCRYLNIPVTIRGAGTSLSGQTVSDSVLMVLGDGWKKIDILENGGKIKLQPAVIGAAANRALLPYGRKIGPDPASIDAATIGGMAANNAGGMCCGTIQSCYQTLIGLRIIFVDGSILDTQDADSVERFKSDHAPMLQKLSALRQKVLANPALTDRIRKKFQMKNTMGYSLNALVDFEDPIDIIAHLLIGSEGTLGFISEITLRTVPEYPYKASSLMIFPNIETACKAVELLSHEPVEAVELMDRTALRSVENKEGIPTYLKSLSETAAALLVETRAPDASRLNEQVKKITSSLKDLPSVLPIGFTDVPSEYEKLWAVRKGLFPSVGAMREVGTTVLIEDVLFPIARLAEAAVDLQALFAKHGYQDTIIYGHALSGNLHFVIKQNFNLPSEVERYRRFIDEVSQLVVGKYDGALKAEHGTGRNMAPYLELEWGAEAVEIMKEIKEIFDPDYLLNPGVILNDDPDIHIKNLKPLPVAHELIDKCIECGFCEVHCVSHGMTLSARQRIVAFREMARLRHSGENPARLQALQKQYAYHGEQTCATDGLCALGCPVSIDTGQLIKSLRHDQVSRLGNWIASTIAGHMSTVTSLARWGLNGVDLAHRIIGTRLMSAITRGMRTLSLNLIPLWNPYMPKGAPRIKCATVQPEASCISMAKTPEESTRRVVYFPSCITRSMGPAKYDRERMALVRKTEALLLKAGFEIIYPPQLNELCCGMAFASKGFKEVGDRKAMELQEALLRASDDGRIPVLCDMSPCLYRMKETLDKQLQLYEPIEFTLTYLVPHLQFQKVPRTVAVHAVCSAKKMGLERKLIELASMCAEKVVTPECNCCGFAGDRGFSFPELNAHGLRHLRKQIPADCGEGYSTSRTCEIGLTYHGGISYQSILYLVDEATTAVRDLAGSRL